VQDSLERERLAALERLEVLDTPTEPLFDSLTELAALTFNTPIALIVLIDQDRLWFKACVGVDVDHTAERSLRKTIEQRDKLIEDLTASNVERGHVVQQLGERDADLRRVLERHRQLINGADDYAVYWLNRLGRVESRNTGDQRLKGYEASEIVGRNYSDFFSARDRAEGEPERILSTALCDGKCAAEGWRMRKDGSAFWAEVTVEAVYDETEALVGFAKISRDASERQRRGEGATFHFVLPSYDSLTPELEFQAHG